MLVFQERLRFKKDISLSTSCKQKESCEEKKSQKKISNIIDKLKTAFRTCVPKLKLQKKQIQTEEIKTNPAEYAEEKMLSLSLKKEDYVFYKDKIYKINGIGKTDGINGIQLKSGKRKFAISKKESIDKIEPCLWRLDKKTEIKKEELDEEPSESIQTFDERTNKETALTDDFEKKKNQVVRKTLSKIKAVFDKSTIKVACLKTLQGSLEMLLGASSPDLSILWTEGQHDLSDPVPLWILTFSKSKKLTRRVEFCIKAIIAKTYLELGTEQMHRICEISSALANGSNISVNMLNSALIACMGAIGVAVNNFGIGKKDLSETVQNDLKGDKIASYGIMLTGISQLAYGIMKESSQIPVALQNSLEPLLLVAPAIVLLISIKRGKEFSTDFIAESLENIQNLIEKLDLEKAKKNLVQYLKILNDENLFKKSWKNSLPARLNIF